MRGPTLGARSRIALARNQGGRFAGDGQPDPGIISARCSAALEGSPHQYRSFPVGYKNGPRKTFDRCAGQGWGWIVDDQNGVDGTRGAAPDSVVGRIGGIAGEGHAPVAAGPVVRCGRESEDIEGFPGRAGRGITRDRQGGGGSGKAGPDGIVGAPVVGDKSAEGNMTGRVKVGRATRVRKRPVGLIEGDGLPCRATRLKSSAGWPGWSQ